MPHKYAEHFKLLAEVAQESDRPWELLQGKPVNGAHEWKDFGTEIDLMHIAYPWACTIRRKPQPRVIDWAKVGSDVPVKVWDEVDTGKVGFFRSYDPSSGRPFKIATGSVWVRASLETGIWVSSVDGLHIWPEGCIVEVQFLGGSRDIGNEDKWEWRLGSGYSYIITSRCVGLAQGWSYE
jgi:hypothetical protein